MLSSEILLYVALDLCLPSMPGAFVFDAAHSIETVQRSRTQDAGAPVVVLAISHEPHGAIDDVSPHMSMRTRITRPVTIPTRAGRSNTTAEFTPPSEDPH